MLNHESGASRDPRVPQNPDQATESESQTAKRQALRNMVNQQSAGQVLAARIKRVCHNCGTSWTGSENIPTCCPHCHSVNVATFGLGGLGESVPAGPPAMGTDCAEAIRPSLGKSLYVTREILQHNIQANHARLMKLQELEAALRPYNTDTIDHILQLVRDLGL